MRLPRPKSLSGLMLLGLAFIAGPLLWAVIDAAFQIRTQAKTSEELVKEGVNTARLTQSMFADINSLQRTVQLYQVIGDVKLLNTYRITDQNLTNTRMQLARLLDAEPTRRALDDFSAMHDEIARAVVATPPGSTAFTT